MSEEPVLHRYCLKCSVALPLVYNREAVNCERCANQREVEQRRARAATANASSLRVVHPTE